MLTTQTMSDTTIDAWRYAIKAISARVAVDFAYPTSEAEVTFYLLQDYEWSTVGDYMVLYK